MNIIEKVAYLFISCNICYGCFAHDNVASADFAELEETVRNNTGDIEELKRQIAELKEQIDQLLGQGSSGDLLFKQEKYDEARKEFIKEYKEAKGKNDKKALECLYKLAQCFKKMKKTKEAKMTLKKLVADYPSSDFCKKAEKELKELK